MTDRSASRSLSLTLSLNEESQPRDEAFEIHTESLPQAPGQVALSERPRTHRVWANHTRITVELPEGEE